jgi:hypothetical protein
MVIALDGRRARRCIRETVRAAKRALAGMKPLVNGFNAGAERGCDRLGRFPFELEENEDRAKLRFERQQKFPDARILGDRVVGKVGLLEVVALHGAAKSDRSDPSARAADSPR